MKSAEHPAAKVLGTEGPFAINLESFTPRTAQRQMASEVAETLEDAGVLVAESGTGTGKTFAYLVPVLLAGKKTIVSTGTKHLQDQIFHRDIPTVSEVMGRSVNAFMLKGRSNYLCRYRLKRNAGQSDLIDRKSGLPFQLIERWASRTELGDISEVTEISDQAPVWKEVTSTSDNCLGSKCPDYKKCFVVAARQKAKDADVVVVNHHLYFSDLALKDDGFGELLPDYQAVVFDEAHLLAEIASMFFGFSISSFQFRDLFSDIASAEREEKSGVNFSALSVPVERALEQMQRSLAGYENQSLPLLSVSSVQFQQAIESLQVALDNLLMQSETAAMAGKALEKCFNRACLLQDRLDQWRSGIDRNLVRWVNVGARFFRLHATPLRIDDRFDMVMSRAKSWIFTSATLAIGDDFSAFSNQLGLVDAKHRQWNSPYDFQNNTLLYMPLDMPDPRDYGYASQLTALIRDVTEASQGRTFCLFTSYAMMNQVHRGLVKTLKWPVMLQGEAPRSKLIDRFVRAGNAVLFGTSSFWEGVDIRGDALSCVIIDKLPFASPGDPVLKSRLEACEEDGGNPFMEIQVPGAAIALKQGAGRLIRSETDHGVLVLCDPRVTTRRYGRMFLDSLPPMPVTRHIQDVFLFFSK